MTCARCGIPLPDGTRFCPQCGEQVGPFGRPPPRDTPFNLLQPAPARPATRVHVDNSCAWALAFVPLLLILLDVLFVRAGAGHNLADWSAVATLATNTPLAILDARRLEAAGVRLSAWWGILVAPVYLVKRTRLARSTPGIPLAWVASFVVYLVATAVLLA